MVASCSAVGCTNHRKRNPELSFFQLPHDHSAMVGENEKERLAKKSFFVSLHARLF